MSFTLNMDNSQVKAYTNKLQQMHRSNFPIAVRQTLNDLAFDVKQKELLRYADKEFILRNPNFFKRFSGVKKAVGFDLKSMNSEVGIIKSTAQGGEAAANLTKQEYGGSISDRSMIYMNQSRISGSKTKRVKKANYLGSKGLVGGKPLKGYGMRTRKSNFVAAAYVAIRENKNVLWETKSGFTLYSVSSLSFSGTGKNRNVKVNATPLASYEKNRSVRIMAHPFLKPASLAAYQKQGYFFIKNAEKRLNK